MAEWIIRTGRGRRFSSRPPRTRRTRKSKSEKTKPRERHVRKREKGDDYIPEFQRAYWFEYGTLSNRDPRHRFVHRRKTKTAGWKGGIRATRDTELAWQMASGAVVGAIPREVTKAADNYDRKNGHVPKFYESGGWGAGWF